jgi:hypothetical protein
VKKVFRCDYSFRYGKYMVRIIKVFISIFFWKKEEHMHDNDKQASPVNSSRRKALKKIAAGGAVAGVLALSGKWSKPVVDSIILPAHAQATNGAAPPPTTPAPTTTRQPPIYYFPT